MSGRRVVLLLTVLGMALSMVYVGSGAAPVAVDKARAEHERIVAFWTPERVAQAIPRDFVMDPGGNAFQRGADGMLTPYGNKAAPVSLPLRAVPSPQAKPPNPGGGGSSDTTPPVISNETPSTGTIEATQTFSATVVDSESGVKSVTVVIRYPDGSTTQNFAASQGADNVWWVTIQGFTEGNWAWKVIAKDNAKKGGNTAETDFLTVTCCGTGGGQGDPGGDLIANAHWTSGGDVQTAVGRIYFEMPANRKKNRWNGYVCSGTVATDATEGRSVIITAAHCVYDDTYKEFARSVLFIPDQDGTTGSGTDTNCSNDPLGCWTPDFGVVDTNWTTRTFPENIPWDYGYYVVTKVGTQHTVLDVAAKSLTVSFAPPAIGSSTHAFGYSYSDDPNLMYCAESLGTEGTDNWWLANCGLSGGSSGGPWIQPFAGGSGPIISVNSWGYTNQPGMAGPILSGTSASCLFTAATTGSESGNSRGFIPNC